MIYSKLPIKTQKGDLGDKSNSFVETKVQNSGSQRGKKNAKVGIERNF